ncbi:MAG TPA: DinB family protein [Methylomirabilota bacterium]|nr:DinB family protein [Methylomirabilota bacterium]
MELTLIQGLYGYHWWATRRLFDVAAALGEDTARKEAGPQFSFPTLKGLFAHILGADTIWLERWKGITPSHFLGDGDFSSMAELRARWDDFEKEHRRFIEGLTSADLARVMDYRDTRGNGYSAPLWQMLQHVANHGTHHRSEIATMLTMLSGSPPPTDLIIYQRIMSGQMKG